MFKYNISKIKLSNLDLIKFSPKDTKLLFQIRNHSSIRKYLENNKSISYVKHLEWVKQNLIEQEKLLLFLIYSTGNPVGFSLIRNQKGKNAEIGLMIKSSLAHPLLVPYSGVITLYIAFNKLIVDQIYSNIAINNKKSSQLALGLGAIEIESEKLNNVKFVFHLKNCLKNKNYVSISNRIKKNMTIIY